MRRQFLAGVLALSATLMTGCSRPAEPAKPAAPAEAPKPKVKAPTLEDTGLATPPDSVQVSILTDKGEIVVELDGKHAPTTTANFLHYVDTHKLDGGTFYRAMKSGEAAGFIQGTANGFTYPPIPHEPTTKTGLSHVNGTISTARYAVGTASNEWTICVGDMTYMDAGRDPSGDNAGFAAFGHVVKGMDVVKKILHGRISSKKAAPGEWQGQTLATPVKIISAKRVS